MYLHKSKIKQVTERDSWIKQAKCKVTFLTQCNIKQLLLRATNIAFVPLTFHKLNL